MSTPAVDLGRRVVVTGSTRGIGAGLARELLRRGAKVVISGRSPDAVSSAVDQLIAEGFVADDVAGQACDITDPAQVQGLWDAAVAAFGGVDIWINNAGISPVRAPLWELDPAVVRDLVDTNLTGAITGCRVALAGMVAQGHGAVYVMEGLGSDGRMAPGFTVYGATKRAVRYVSKALSKEAAGTAVLVGAISPGIVLTELLLSDDNPEGRARARKIYGILADTVETVTPFLADRVLANSRNGARIAWLTPGKVMVRFATAKIRPRRDVIAEVDRLMAPDAHHKEQASS
jgi:NAD(P)-dependent dehydrogenase (short-subunit alcohol dehydrogenase family)